MSTMDKLMIIVCILMALAAGGLLVDEMSRYDDQAQRIEMKLKSP